MPTSTAESKNEHIADKRGDLSRYCTFYSMAVLCTQINSGFCEFTATVSVSNTMPPQLKTILAIIYDAPLKCSCGIHKCEIHATGDFACKCLKGYNNTDPKTCEDIDECKSDLTNSCGDNKCVNIVGNYKCECVDKNQELHHDHVCLDEVENKIDDEKESGINNFKWPDDVVAQLTVVGLSMWVIFFHIWVVISMTMTISKAIYTCVSTEPYSDDDSDYDDQFDDKNSFLEEVSEIEIDHLSDEHASVVNMPSFNEQPNSMDRSVRFFSSFFFNWTEMGAETSSRKIPEARRPTVDPSTVLSLSTRNPTKSHLENSKEPSRLLSSSQ